MLLFGTAGSDTQQQHFKMGMGFALCLPGSSKPWKDSHCLTLGGLARKSGFRTCGGPLDSAETLAGGFPQDRITPYKCHPLWAFTASEVSRTLVLSKSVRCPGYCGFSPQTQSSCTLFLWHPELHVHAVIPLPGSNLGSTAGCLCQLQPGIPSLCPSRSLPTKGR